MRSHERMLKHHHLLTTGKIPFLKFGIHILFYFYENLSCIIFYNSKHTIMHICSILVSHNHYECPEKMFVPSFHRLRNWILIFPRTSEYIISSISITTTTIGPWESSLLNASLHLQNWSNESTFLTKS